MSKTQFEFDVAEATAPVKDCHGKEFNAMHPDHPDYPSARRHFSERIRDEQDAGDLRAVER